MKRYAVIVEKSAVGGVDDVRKIPLSRAGSAFPLFPVGGRVFVEKDGVLVRRWLRRGRYEYETLAGYAVSWEVREWWSGVSWEVCLSFGVGRRGKKALKRFLASFAKWQKEEFGA